MYQRGKESYCHIIQYNDNDLVVVNKYSHEQALSSHTNKWKLFCNHASFLIIGFSTFYFYFQASKVELKTVGNHNISSL